MQRTMNKSASMDFTRQLHAWQAGHDCALDQVIEKAHTRLLEIARRLMANEVSGHTLPPAGLVNEVYLRINELRRMQWCDRQHFYSVSANLMRRILIDHARARSAAKRGGELVQVTLDEDLPDFEHRLDLLELDEALTKLAARTQASLSDLLPSDKFLPIYSTRTSRNSMTVVQRMAASRIGSWST